MITSGFIISFVRFTNNRWHVLSQAPLKKWTEHSQELHLLKIRSRGLLLHPGAGWGLIFWIMSFYNPKKFISRSFKWGVKKFFEFTGTCFFKLLKHGHFWVNFRFWLVWVQLRKSKALSSLSFLQRHEKYQIGSCPQLLYA